MKNIMVNRSKVALFISILLINLSCKKNEPELNVLKLAELSAYKVTEKKLNDSTAKVFGENDNYTIEGVIDLSNKAKQKWWKIRNKYNKDWVDIEYIYLNKQVKNQIRIYKNGVFENKLSQFYSISPASKGYKFIFHFPESNYNTTNVEFDYIVSDTIQQKRILKGTIKCERNDNYYSCFLPINKDENIIGIVTKFSNFKEKDSVLLAVDKMYIKPLNKQKIHRQSVNSQ